MYRKIISSNLASHKLL